MRILTRFIVFACLLFPAMKTQANRSEWIESVKETEAAFASLAKTSGLKEAFLVFADEAAVINRGNKLYRGKEKIASFYGSQQLNEVSLEWAPEFVDVSEDGTMAYTYGPYTFSAVTADGKAIEAKGIFHTVWKRQPDGSWKYVYD